MRERSPKSTRGFSAAGLVSEIIKGAGSRSAKTEFTVVVEGTRGPESPTEEVLKAEIRRLQQEGPRVKEIAEVLGENYSYPTREIYRLVVKTR
jgi:16S rRNA C1402 (ribose-2'-O) methylase RsmI